ncbi:MAG: non-homologous end-joining DNA ligase [Myxococcales bacterium]|nr:non-homologous end-joining DNA ligase [Myxococcales bacterium]
MLKNLDKVMYPQAGFTKGDVVAYYRAVAPALLPHLSGRAVTLARFPDGVEGAGWYQSNCPKGAPKTVEVTRARTVRYCLIDDLEALLWAVNLGTLELHPFLAPAADPDRPRAMVLDLDPGPGAGLAHCCEVAMRLRRLLDPDPSSVKTSGAKGLHVYVPVSGTYAETKARARELARALPEHLATDRHELLHREGKVLIDWRQNDPNRSTIAPWSLRATRVPLVSTPLRWEELADPSRLAFSPAMALERLERDGDPFARFR